MDPKMFCFQCQETAGNTGCLIKGVCGKEASTARLQDLLLFVVRGISVLERELRRLGQDIDVEVYHFNTDALFCTITNANFDDESIAARVDRGLDLRDALAERLRALAPVPNADAVTWRAGREAYDAKAGEVGVLAEPDADKRSLAELIIYGLKGMAAYVEHALRLGHEDLDLNRFMCEAMAALTVDDLDVDGLVALTLRTGEYGVKSMAQLDAANTGTYGHPEVTEVSIDAGKRPGILISGHDLKDLEMLLEQTEGKGVDVYTHGEMLPAHYYPAFKKYKHFVGNYGNAWWQQREEFTAFNGPFSSPPTASCRPFPMPPTKTASTPLTPRAIPVGSTLWPTPTDTRTFPKSSKWPSPAKRRAPLSRVASSVASVTTKSSPSPTKWWKPSSRVPSASLWS